MRDLGIVSICHKTDIRGACLAKVCHGHVIELSSFHVNMHRDFDEIDVCIKASK